MGSDSGSAEPYRLLGATASSQPARPAGALAPQETPGRVYLCPEGGGIKSGQLREYLLHCLPTLRRAPGCLGGARLGPGLLER